MEVGWWRRQGVRVAGMQHPPSVPPTAPPSGYMYPWLPPAPIVPIYERLTTHLVRHDTLDLLRCPTLLPNKGPPYQQQYWRHKHRFSHRFPGRCVLPWCWCGHTLWVNTVARGSEAGTRNVDEGGSMGSSPTLLPSPAGLARLMHSFQYIVCTFSIVPLNTKCSARALKAHCNMVIHEPVTLSQACSSFLSIIT